MFQTYYYIFEKGVKKRKKILDFYRIKLERKKMKCKFKIVKKI